MGDFLGSKFRDHTGKEAPFFRCATSVFTDECLSWRARLVYAALASFADKDGYCFPSFKALKKRAGLGSHNTLLKGIRELEAAGFIRKDEHGRSNGYHLGWTVNQSTMSSSDAHMVTSRPLTMSPRDQQLDPTELDPKTRSSKPSISSPPRGTGSGNNEGGDLRVERTLAGLLSEIRARGRE